VKNPFITSRVHGVHMQAADVESRLDKVKGFSPDQLRAALRVEGLQSTVRLAIERRLRKLEQAK